MANRVTIMKKVIKRICARLLINVLSKCEKSMLFYIFDKVNQKHINSSILDEALVSCALGYEN